MTTNPFTSTAKVDHTDAILATKAASGDKHALESLIRRHQGWVYNIARRMMLNPADAADVTQEALIKVVTRIAQFEGKAAFRTWAYRIIVNTMLNAKRGGIESHFTGFSDYGTELDRLPLEPLDLSTEQEPERRLIVEEAKNGCMLGMLMCLTRDQRIVYILGEIFEAPSAIGASILEISPAAFRKRLERARSDLVAFMNDKCGLLNTDNPCRCEKKATSFIKAGWVDPTNRKFAPKHLHEVKQRAPEAAKALDEFMDQDYAVLFHDHPSYEADDLTAHLASLISDPEAKRVFDL